MSFSVKKTVEPEASKSVIMRPLSTFILQVSLSLLLTLLLQRGAAAASSLAGNEDDEAFVEFIRFQKTFGKVYGSQEIRRERFETFKQNLRNIRRHNGRSDATYTMGVTQFADLTGKIIHYL